MSNYSFNSVIFDMDGVITKTALVHSKAWKKTFDEYLRLREKRDGEEFREFTHDGDYLLYVDGKPRYKGVQSFLQSREIEIPFGEASDPPDAETACGLGNKKNLYFRQVLEEEGPKVFQPAIDLIKALKDNGIKVGVASSSKNCQLILSSAGVEELFDTRIDGIVSDERGLEGKPEGDIFVEAAKECNSRPENSIVLEDANSGVAAGRNGGFGLVLGVARRDNKEELFQNGADIVITGMEGVTIEKLENWFRREPVGLFDNWDNYSRQREAAELPGEVNPFYMRSAREILLGDKKTVLFLDYDGTLTPIVDRPDMARVSDGMRTTVQKLAGKYTTAVVSGRMREDVEDLLGVKGIFYAGSHGFDIKGEGLDMVHPAAEKAVPVVNECIKILKEKTEGIEGIIIEEKKYSVAVHYRMAEEKHLPDITEMVKELVSSYDVLRLMSGKKVFELLPNIEWNKSRAIHWIMKAMELSWTSSSVIYIGDDVTDEYAFRGIRTRGTGILVSEKSRPSAAEFRLKDPEEVKELFEKIIG